MGRACGMNMFLPDAVGDPRRKRRNLIGNYLSP